MARILLRELSDVDWSSALRFLTREDVPKSIERKAVAAIKRDIGRRGRAEAKREREWKRLSSKSRAVFRESLAGSLSDAELQDVKSVVRLAVEQAPSSKDVKLKVEKEEPSIVFGSVEATITPPYNFWWTDEDTYGPADVHAVADKSDGTFNCYVTAPQDGDESSGWAWSALGILFSPFYNGNVRFGARPIVDYWWYDASFLADSKSRGAVGLLVYRFKLDGTLDPPPPSGSPVGDSPDYIASTDDELWYDDSGGGDNHQGEKQPTLTVDFPVSKSRFYNLWCYARVNASADGGGWYYDSAAAAWMAGNIPSLKWKFVT